MLTFVSGGAASGKSGFAERLALKKGAECLYYVATMDPEGIEAAERIEKHREERAGKNFITVERKMDLEELRLPSSRDRSLILLEDLGNLVANEQFERGGSDEEIFGRVKAGIISICEQAEEVIVVGDDIFSDGGGYSEETWRYVRLLGESAVYIAGLADSVWEVVLGIALPIKV